MKVSIITIVFNNREYIADCIQSVINQTYQNIEYIVVDGGSTDGTKDIIESFKEGIAIYESGPDSGLYDALNKGIKLATGDVIGILHSDDLFYDGNVIEDVVKSFNSGFPNIVYGNGIYVDRADVSKIRRIYSSSAFRKAYLRFGWIPLHTTIFVRREVFDRIGLYDLRYSIASDYDISLRWFLDSDLDKVHISKYLVRMRLGGKSTTISLQIKKSLEDLKIINSYRLLGAFTLILKVVRKVPQYIKPIFINIRGI